MSSYSQILFDVADGVATITLHRPDKMNSQNLTPDTAGEIEAITRKIASALSFKGLFNIQMAVKGGTVYVLEVNPRASRTVPFVTKATGVPIAAIAARVQCGESLESFGLPPVLKPLAVCVKCPTFPFSRFPGCDPLLGPEMKSTGETMGIGASFSEAYAKAMLASGIDILRPVEVGDCGKWNKTMHAKFAPISGKPGILVSTSPRATSERVNALSQGITCITSNFAATRIADCRARLSKPPQELPLRKLTALGLEQLVAINTDKGGVAL